MVVSNKFRTFAPSLINKTKKTMDKNLNVRVVALPITKYDKEWLDTLKDEELSETACAEGDSIIWSNLDEFQKDLNLSGGGRITDLNWIYFLTDLA